MYNKLEIGGIGIIITFHSLEHDILENFFGKMVKSVNFKKFL